MSSEDKKSILSHVSIGTNKFKEAIQFYDAVFEAIGIKRVIELLDYNAVAYGKAAPEFWVQTPCNDLPAQTANGIHFGFSCETKEQVQEFYAAAIKAGGVSEGEPGPRPHYGIEYYGCFVKDLDGHKIEAMHWQE